MKTELEIRKSAFRKSRHLKFPKHWNSKVKHKKSCEEFACPNCHHWRTSVVKWIDVEKGLQIRECEFCLNQDKFNIKTLRWVSE